MRSRFAFTLLTATLLTSSPAPADEASDDRTEVLGSARKRYEARAAELRAWKPPPPPAAPAGVLEGSYVARADPALLELMERRGRAWDAARKPTVEDGITVDDRQEAFEALVAADREPQLKLLAALIDATRAADVGVRTATTRPYAGAAFELAAAEHAALMRAHHPDDALRLCGGLWRVLRNETVLAIGESSGDEVAITYAFRDHCKEAVAAASEPARLAFADEVEQVRASWPAARPLLLSAAVAAEAASFGYLIESTPPEQIERHTSHGRFHPRAVICTDSCMGTPCEEDQRNEEIASNAQCEHLAWRHYGEVLEPLLEKADAVREADFDTLREQHLPPFRRPDERKDLACTLRHEPLDRLFGKLASAVRTRAIALGDLEKLAHDARHPPKSNPRKRGAPTRRFGPKPAGR